MTTAYWVPLRFVEETLTPLLNYQLLNMLTKYGESACAATIYGDLIQGHWFYTHAQWHHALDSVVTDDKIYPGTSNTYEMTL